MVKDIEILLMDFVPVCPDITDLPANIVRSSIYIYFKRYNIEYCPFGKSWFSVPVTDNIRESPYTPCSDMVSVLNLI